MHSSRYVPPAAVAVGRGVLHQAPPGPFPQGAGTTQGAGTSPGIRPPGPGTPPQQAPLTAGTPTPGADPLPQEQTPPPRDQAAPVNRILGTRLWKYYLAQTSFSGGKNNPLSKQDESNIYRYLYSAICNPWRPSQSTRDRSMLLQKDDGSVCIRAILPLTVLDTGGCEVCLCEVMRSTCCIW